MRPRSLHTSPFTPSPSQLDLLRGAGGAPLRATPLAMSCQLAPTASPRLLLFQHVEKTGGTSLREWLKTRAHDTARFGVVPYTSAACFLCRHRELALCPVPCHKDGPLLRSSIHASCDLMKSSVAVEFHASIGHALFLRLRPYLAELRRKYAAHNGTLRTLTILREPVAHMLSVFRMWPPRMPRRTATTIRRQPLTSSSRSRSRRRRAMDLPPPPSRRERRARALLLRRPSRRRTRRRHRPCRRVSRRSRRARSRRQSPRGGRPTTRAGSMRTGL